MRNDDDVVFDRGPSWDVADDPLLEEEDSPGEPTVPPGADDDEDDE